MSTDALHRDFNAHVNPQHILSAHIDYTVSIEFESIGSDANVLILSDRWIDRSKGFIDCDVFQDVGLTSWKMQKQ